MPNPYHLIIIISFNTKDMIISPVHKNVSGHSMLYRSGVVYTTVGGKCVKVGEKYERSSVAKVICLAYENALSARSIASLARKFSL